MESQRDNLDLCLSQADETGAFHYDYWTPCTLEGKGPASKTKPTTLCKDSSVCMSDAAQFAKKIGSSGQVSPYASTSNHGGYVGLAKDGHFIMGPYNSSGQPWSCSEHDVCNGATVDGSYVYTATESWPYTVGCWGPAAPQTHEAICSTTSCFYSGDYTYTPGKFEVTEKKGDDANTVTGSSDTQTESPYLASLRNDSQAAMVQVAWVASSVVLTLASL